METIKKHEMHRPGFEPGYSAWKADIIAARPSVPGCGLYLNLQSINIFGSCNNTLMPDRRPDKVKKDIAAIAAKYGIEVVGFLKLDGEATIPTADMDLLRGVKWADKEVDLTNVKNPVEIMPSARTMIILGKRLMDDGRDVYYRVSGDYIASAEMMVLDIASLKVADRLRKGGYQGEEYTSYYLKAWAALAGLGWIGRSRMFVSKSHGPRFNDLATCF